MEQFEIGDEVIFIKRPTNTKFVITNVNVDGSLNGIGKDGIAFCDKYPQNWEKTGRKFPQAKLLMDALQKDGEQDDR